MDIVYCFYLIFYYETGKNGRCLKLLHEDLSGKGRGRQDLHGAGGLSGQPEDAARTGFTEEAGLTIEAAWNPFTPFTPASGPILRMPLTASFPLWMR